MLDLRDELETRPMDTAYQDIRMTGYSTYNYNLQEETDYKQSLWGPRECDSSLK